MGASECLVCGCRIAVDGGSNPICATVWNSTGGSISEVVDITSDDRHLEAVVCDACTRRQEGRITTVVHGPLRSMNKRYPGIVEGD